jgi:antitoxin CcdA
MNERVTVEVDAETLKRAREAGLDLSELLTRAMQRVLPQRKSEEQRKREADAWYAENKEAVDAYNEFVERHGLFSDGIRTF